MIVLSKKSIKWTEMSQRSTDQGGGIEMLKAPEWPLPAETLVKKLRNAPFRESHFLNTYFLNSRGGVFHIIYFLSIFHILSLVSFSIYGVKSRSGHDGSQSVGWISHTSGRKLSYWGNFIMVLHGFASRSSKNTVFHQKTLSLITKRTCTQKFPTNPKNSL